MKGYNQGNKSRRKAQISGQVFIYILAGFIFVFILMYGYNAIRGLMEKSEQVSLIDLKSNLESAVKSVRSSADVKKRVVTIPSKYDELCFIDLKKNPPASLESTYPIIHDSWESQVQKNAFLVPNADFDIFLGDIEIDDPGFVCLTSVNGQIELRLEGKGDRTKISGW